MKHLNNFNKHNEEIKLKDVVVGGALAASTMLGTGCEPLPKVRVDKVENVTKEGEKFFRFDITTKYYEKLYSSSSEDGFSYCRWFSFRGKKHSRSRFTISVPEGTERIYKIAFSFFERNFITGEEISDNFYTIEEDFKFVKQVEGGKIYSGNFPNPYTLFVYDRGYNQQDNLFEVNGRKFNVHFVADGFLGSNYFIIPLQKENLK